MRLPLVVYQNYSSTRPCNHPRPPCADISIRYWHIRSSSVLWRLCTPGLHFQLQPREPSERAPFVTPRTTLERLSANSKRVAQGHEKGQKNRPQKITGINEALQFSRTCRPQDGRTGPRDRHHRDERGRFALEPAHLRLSCEDARRQGREKMSVSSHWCGSARALGEHANAAAALLRGKEPNPK